jgi:hypothetical protein
MCGRMKLVIAPLLANGCAPEPCRTGTLYLTLAYSGTSVAAGRSWVVFGGQVATMVRTRDQAGGYPPDAFGFGCSVPGAVH